jgi:hypothetical protein
MWGGSHSISEISLGTHIWTPLGLLSGIYSRTFINNTLKINKIQSTAHNHTTVRVQNKYKKLEEDITMDCKGSHSSNAMVTQI